MGWCFIVRKEFDISRFDKYREDNRREVKKANGGLPVSLWDTYSSFANCYGGVIILGIKESGKRRIKLLLQIQAMSEPVKNRCVWAENLIHEINLS